MPAFGERASHYSLEQSVLPAPLSLKTADLSSKCLPALLTVTTYVCLSIANRDVLNYSCSSAFLNILTCPFRVVDGRYARLRASSSSPGVQISVVPSLLSFARLVNYNFVYPLNYQFITNAILTLSSSSACCRPESEQMRYLPSAVHASATFSLTSPTKQRVRKAEIPSTP